MWQFMEHPFPKDVDSGGAAMTEEEITKGSVGISEGGHGQTNPTKIVHLSRLLKHFDLLLH